MTNGVARIPDPREWRLTRSCTGCGKQMAWARFAPKTYWPDGSVRTVASWCHTCEAEAQRQRPRVSQAHRFEYKRAWRLERSRAAAAERSRTPNGHRLPVEPVRMFIQRRIRDDGMDILEIADVCGIPERAVHRLLRDHEHVSLRLADTIATRLGVHLYDLYPELAEDAA